LRLGMRTRVRRRNGRSGRRVQGVSMMLCARRKFFFLQIAVLERQFALVQS